MAFPSLSPSQGPQGGTWLLSGVFAALPPRAVSPRPPALTTLQCLKLKVIPMGIQGGDWLVARCRQRARVLRVQLGHRYPMCSLPPQKTAFFIYIYVPGSTQRAL